MNMYRSKFIFHLFVLFTLLASLLGSTIGVTPAHAAGIIVNTDAGNTTAGDTFCTLPEAIGNANTNSDTTGGDCFSGSGVADTITFDSSLAGGTIHLASSLFLNGNATIDGSALNTPITISGDSDNDGDGDVQVFFISISTTATLKSLVIDKGNASDGGGIYNHGTLTIQNSTISDSHANGYGGGIINQAAGTLTLTNSNVSNNDAGDGGGGIANLGNLTITNSVIALNSNGSVGGGGIYNTGTLTLTGSKVSDNATDGYGGGIHHSNNTSMVTITNSTISGNTAVEGGGFYKQNGTATITNSTISENFAVSFAGGVYNSLGALTVTSSTFSGNSAPLGGGLQNGSSGTLTVTNSTFAENEAPGVGAGSGMYNSGTATLTNSTFADNSGDALYNYAGTLNYANTLIAYSSGGDCVNLGGGSIGTNTNNLVEDGSCSASLNGDPGLGNLDDNGGLTRTVALLSGSIAIDAGDNTTCAASPVNNLDQRGVTRPFNTTCDIGAYEYRPIYTVTTASDDNDACDSSCSLREAINAANADSEADIIRFNTDYTITLGSTLPSISEDLIIDGEDYTIIIDGASSFGVMHVQSGSTSLKNMTIRNGSAANGGAIANNVGATLSITNMTFSSNTASSNGGAIRNIGTLTVTNSTFTSNSATGWGGAVFNGGTLSAANVTFSANTAGTGGALYSETTATITNSTFSGNSGSAIYTYVTGTLNLANTIVANSTGSDCQNISINIGINTNNLVEDGSCSAAFSGDPGLGPLADNGGPTQTFVLLFGSPALDTGNITACSVAPVNNLDQRGVTRSLSSYCDIGAFESHLQGDSAFVVNLPDDTDDGFCELYVNGFADCTLREAINAANTFSGADTITFDSGYTIRLASTLTVTEDLTIDGSGLASKITISGDSDGNGTGDVRVLHIVDDPLLDVVLDSLIVTKGQATGADLDDEDGDGGAILNEAYLTITNSTFSNNSATGYGGAVNNNRPLIITNSTFSGNSSTGDGGGGGAIMNNSTLTISGSTFSGNTGHASNSNGGAIYSTSNNSATITNSTFSGNSAAAGGAILTIGDLTITNSTISGNSATNSSFVSGLDIEGGTTNIRNTIIANSTLGIDCLNNATIGTNASNLVEDGTCSPALSGDPKLGPLDDNGGPTETFALLVGSPALDAGNTSACAAAPVNDLDQRGISRTQDIQCDIGAFELEPDNVDVYIGGSLQNSYELFNNTSLLQNYPGILNGPVRVTSPAGGSFFPSQVVTSGASYNELLGYPDNQLHTEYWFPWYDHGYPSVSGSSMRTWLAIGNPHATLTADVDVYIGGIFKANYDIAPGGQATPRWIGLQDGPVRIVSTNGVDIFASQRVFTVPDNSFNESMGYPSDQFVTEYWFPWYDSTNMNSSLMIGNTSSSTPANVDVYIGGVFKGSYVIGFNDTLIQSYAGLVNGPVRVVGTNGVNIVVSQRVRSGPKNSYNEVMGYPNNQFHTEYWFPWYDHGYPSVSGSNMRTWLAIGNPHATLTADVDVYIDGVFKANYDIPAGGQATPRWIGLQDGPVQIISLNGVDIFASQRVFTVPNSVFNEMLGFPADQLTSQYWFPWYDNVNMNARLYLSKP